VRVQRFVKWSVRSGAEGYTIDLGTEDVGLPPGGGINLALDKARILLYLATYLLYSRLQADENMKPEEFEEAMRKFGYERKLVSSLIKKDERTLADELKDKVKSVTDNPGP